MWLVEQLLQALPEPRIKQEKQLQELSDRAQAADASGPAAADVLTVQCPQCGHTARLKRKALGRKARCGNCQKIFLLAQSGT